MLGERLRRSWRAVRDCWTRLDRDWRSVAVGALVVGLVVAFDARVPW